jgi:hypothetical protein
LASNGEYAEQWGNSRRKTEIREKMFLKNIVYYREKNWQVMYVDVSYLITNMNKNCANGSKEGLHALVSEEK